MTAVEDLLAAVGVWAARRPEIVGVALVGSHARGEATDDSDVDLVVLSTDRHLQLGDRSWLSEFGIPASLAVEQWGAVVSLRVVYADGLEVEFGVAAPGWARVDPVDPGTADVVRGGFRIIHDPDGILAALVAVAG